MLSFEQVRAQPLRESRGQRGHYAGARPTSPALGPSYRSWLWPLRGVGRAGTDSCPNLCPNLCTTCTKRGRKKETPVATGRESFHHPLRDVGRCVLLSCGDDAPPEFLALMQRIGIEVSIIGHEVAAFSQLALFERERERAMSLGLLKRPRTALIIAERDRWNDLEPLLKAVRRHLPSVSVWIATADLWLEVTTLPDRQAPEHSEFPDLPPTLRLGSDVERDRAAQFPPLTGPALANPADTSEDEARLPALLQPEPQPELKPELKPDAKPEPKPEPPPPPSRTRPPMDSAVTPEEIEMLLRLFPHAGDEKVNGGGHDEPERGS